MSNSNGSELVLKVERTVTRADIASRIADSLEIDKSRAKYLLDTVIDEIKTAIAAGKVVKFNQFGVFSTRPRKARMASNPRTGEPAPVPAGTRVRFKASRVWKDALNGNGNGNG